MMNENNKSVLCANEIDLPVLFTIVITLEHDVPVLFVNNTCEQVLFVMCQYHDVPVLFVRNIRVRNIRAMSVASL